MTEQQHGSTADGATTPVFVDTHCHLDDEGFGADLDEVLARSRQLGVGRWINVGFNPDRWRPAIDLAARNPGISFTLGVHPGDAERWNDEIASALDTLLRTTGPVGVGEIGLDFFRGETNVDQQVTAFNAQLDLALDHDLPVVIHMRSAESRILDIVRARTRLPRLLFHSFDGSPALTDFMLESNSYAGVGGLATRTKSSHILRELRRLSSERLLLETDSPYLVPNGFKHRRNTPESIPKIAALVASLLDTDVAHVATLTTRNAERLFERLPAP